CKILKYRLVKSKGKQFYQLVLNKTPFYAEAGGQVGDSGTLESVNEKIVITNTVKENNLLLHIAPTLPENPETTFVAKVNADKRLATQNNHTTTHLIHYALRKVLGTHVEQKGSLVHHERLRFDFSHFSKVSNEELERVENLVNDLVRENILLKELRNISIEAAKTMGAIALFGEKYENTVRVIQFGDSIELCGGTHTSATGNIGLVKIVSESAIAAGIRRIEAISGKYAEDYVRQYQQEIEEIKQLLNAPKVIPAIKKLTQEMEAYRKTIETFEQERTLHFVNRIKKEMTDINGINILQSVNNFSAELLKNAAYQLKTTAKNLLIVLGTYADNKANIVIALSDDMIEKGYNAAQLVREIAPLIQGGGGGQPTLATAGGKNTEGLKTAIEKVIAIITKQ
ncbi:MAG TPA: DHHA1 domain-containing protein, partial [Bacteroidales bacterium]|nr:DHHA1 domain-containing protein [Bacteroidales bacterium]